MRSTVLFMCLAFCALPLSTSRADDLDRPGIGEWCYDPLHSPTKAEKIAFVSEVAQPAIEAEQKWGVPAPILAGMTIVESGFGTTRLAVKSNNILAFKWPGDKIAAGHVRFTLWCQPKHDDGNIYPSFGTRGEAIDFVASRLKLSGNYKTATAAYGRDLINGVDRKIAAHRWLVAIAPVYNWKPEKYIPNVLQMTDDPIGDQSIVLWTLRP